MKLIVWNEIGQAERRQVLRRPKTADDANRRESVVAILRDVKEQGDDAVRSYSRMFDGFPSDELRVHDSEIANALEQIEPRLRDAIALAAANLSAFHRAQVPQNVRMETMPGVACELHWRPVERVGFYVPGGTAPLFSSVLMQAIPARLAGCPYRILCTPPQRDGKIHSAILAAAAQCGIENVYAVGGAQAIAAMAYGTASIPKVDKISGPGNVFVTLAKQMVAQDPDGAAIDLPAGPSEVMVVADDTARPNWVAADLLAQAEHGTDAQVMLVTTNSAIAASVQRELLVQIATLPRRGIAEASLSGSAVIVVPDMETALDVVNAYAPEHVILHNKNAEDWLPEIRNAGSVFVGRYSPETAGDYASGTNHVLPTGGYARSRGGITVFTFLKSMTVQTLNPDGLRRLGPALIQMAEAEGLHAHANAVSIRLGAA